MAQKVPVSGVVEAVNDRGLKLGGKWFNFARNFNGGRPVAGDSISFDAYGEDNNLVYRVANSGGSNGSSNGSGVGSGTAPGGTGSVHGRRTGGDGNPRESALIAAATAMQHMDGTVEQIGQAVVAVAAVFEAYLSGQRADEELTY